MYLVTSRQLSAGSSGQVYRGFYNGTIVAIKVLEKHRGEDRVEAFKHEFKVLK